MKENERIWASRILLYGEPTPWGNHRIAHVPMWDEDFRITAHWDDPGSRILLNGEPTRYRVGDFGTDVDAIRQVLWDWILGVGGLGGEVGSKIEDAIDKLEWERP